MNIINLYENYNSYFSADLKVIFELISKVASINHYKVYLIGGLVRDLLLNIESFDIDITVEGNAIEFARILEREYGASVLSIHESFATIKLDINGVKIDFASTRSEIYPKNGHLPDVKEVGCSLKKDVQRRDFTINSLALSLNQGSFMDLTDYVNGYQDLKTNKIKILHKKSFIEDPTRILRALKYSVRMNLKLDEKTLKVQQEYLQNVNYDVCNKRLKNEFKKIFEQNSKIAQIAFDEFAQQKIYKLITKNEVKKLEISIEDLLNKYKVKHPWLIYFGVIAVFEDDNFLDKFELTKYEKEIILNAKNLLNKNLIDDFDIYKSFKNKKLETLLILIVLGKEKEVVHYLDSLRKIKISINGNDILNLGILPSKVFGETLVYVLKEKLKNPNLKKVEELKLVKEYLLKDNC